MRQFLHQVRLAPLLLLLLGAIHSPVQAAELDLEAAFRQPPPSARPWTFWFWNGGLISREGITADLEAMQRAGIGGVVIMEVSGAWWKVPGDPQRIPFLSDPWRGLWRHTVAEAARLGLSITMHQSPGWCGSGGPWVTEATSAQRVVASETAIHGGTAVDMVLPQAGKGYYRDIAVLALPLPEAEALHQADRTQWTNPSGAVAWPALLDPPTAQANYIQIAFPRSTPACGIDLDCEAGPGDELGKVLGSDDGKQWTELAAFIIRGRHSSRAHIPGGIRFAPTSKKFYRLVYDRHQRHKDATSMVPLRITSLKLSGRLGIPDLQKKMFDNTSRNSRGYVAPDARHPEVPPAFAIDRSRIIDLSRSMDDGGRLRWQAPVGDWVVLRFGHTPVGLGPTPVPPGGGGLDCDKLDADAVDAHLAAMIGRLIADAGGETGKTLVATHIDSWETGGQNWTRRMPEEFRRRRGYDLTPYLPVMANRVVADLDVSDRFLWDLRQTVADLLVENYAGRMREYAHRHGMRLSIEGYEGPIDDLTYAGQADEPMCEFWGSSGVVKGGFRPPRLMASAAHTNGRPVTSAEAFTNGGKWEHHPSAIKARGDSAFCNGVNRLVFHRAELNPFVSPLPVRMGLFPYGIYHQRQQPWWEMADAYHLYIARCQQMLQSGRFVADLLVLHPEAGPDHQPGIFPRRMWNDHDICAPEVVLRRLKVVEGSLVLPDGMSYRLLVLPSARTMTPALLTRVRDLVLAGATVLGQPPERSPSLSGYPACDAEIATLARELWGDPGAPSERQRRVGAGLVLRGMSPEDALADIRVEHDFRCSGADVDYIHRRIGDADVYFLASDTKAPIVRTCSFRVGPRQPELWDPQTGRIVVPAQYLVQGEQVHLPIAFGTGGSVFVVFRRPAIADPVVAAGRQGEPLVGLSLPAKPVAEPAALPCQVTLAADGRMSVWADRPGIYELATSTGGRRSVAVSAVPSELALAGPWSLALPPGMGVPERVEMPTLVAWNAHQDPGVQVFSGVGVYTTDCEIPDQARGDGRRLILDLGQVAVMAKVRVNGMDAATLWHPPFVCDVTDLLRIGSNRIEVSVASTIVNRLIGDLRLPDQTIPPDWYSAGKGPAANGRVTAMLSEFEGHRARKEDVLQPAGLIGPVRIRTVLRLDVP